MSNAGAKRKKTHIPSDFKRRKAKVGKRAVQQVNLTDTSFKAVSVQVQGQSIANAAALSAGELVSSRGRSIHDLTSQLHHPAAAVRVSAIRGLTNVIQTTPFVILATHLSTLLPVISKCACVDEEGDVRNLGLGALRELVRNENEGNVPLLWKPFIPLLSAFVTSALNSLDRSTRLDGSRAVDILSHLPLDHKNVATILPAYITLLKDHSHTTNKKLAAESGGGGGRKKKKPDENKRLVVLQSLVSLLQRIDAVEDDVSSLRTSEPDLVILPGGKSTNALLLTAPRRSHPVEALKDLSSLAAFVDDQPESTGGDQGEMKQSTVMDIFAKLRDVYVEVTQRGAQGDTGGLTASVADMEELSLLISGIHLLWKCFARKIKNPVMSHLVNLMLESMPVRSRTQDQLPRYEALNGNLSIAVIEMGTDLLKDSKWTDAILDYLLPRLDAQYLNQSEITMNVLWGLMHLRDQYGQLSVSIDARAAVLERITEVFFPADGNVETDVARSPGGHKAIKMAISILEDNQYKIPETIHPIIRCFPLYLNAWRNDHLPKSDDLVETLHHIAQRVDLASSLEANLVDTLRNSLSSLFLAEKKQQTTFELFSLQLQRKTICLMVSLGSPASEMLKSLGKICGSSGMSHELGSYILDVMHTARRTMSMPSYLAFVVASIGVPKSSIPKAGVAWVTVCDKATLRASQSLRRSGTTKVLPMVSSRLSSWLSNTTQTTLVRFRIALLLIAIFAQDVAIFDEVPDLRKSLSDALFDFFGVCAWENEKSELFKAFEKPLTALFSAQPQFLGEIIQESAIRLNKDKETGSVVNALHELSRKVELAEAIRGHPVAWMESVNRIVGSLAESPSLYQAQLMLTNVELVIGITKD